MHIPIEIFWTTLLAVLGWIITSIIKHRSALDHRITYSQCKENRTDFVTPNRNHLLAVQTKGSYNNTVLVIPPAGNATKTYISFDGSEYMYLVPQNREYILPTISDSWSHYFEIIYEIEQGIQVVSAPYYYTRSSQSELLPRLRSY